MNPFILLIVGAIGLIGCLILLFMGLQMLKEERAKKEGAEAPAANGGEGQPAPAAPQAETPAPAPAAPVKQSPSFADRLGLGARPRSSAHEVLRLLRDNLTGRLVIEIAGRRYNGVADVDDPATYQGLLTILRDLSDFAGVGTEGLLAPDAAPRAAPILPAPSQIANLKSPLPANAAPDRRELPRSPAPAPGPAKPLPPPSMNPFKQMQVLRELAKIPEMPTLTIAEQIDEVLQARILGTPLVQRGLRMRPGPRGDAIFELEGATYAAVDEVPDAEAREVIRAAIVAWESK